MVKFTGLSVAARVNEIYNIVPTVGNWFGADIERSKLEDRLREYDNDLMKYYQDHQAGIRHYWFCSRLFRSGACRD